MLSPPCGPAPIGVMLAMLSNCSMHLQALNPSISAMLLQAEIFSAPTGTKAAFVVKCTKGRRYRGGFHCTYGRGPAKPAYMHP